MNDEEMDALRAMTPEQQQAWFRCEERKAWWMHFAGWCLLIPVYLFMVLSVFKTWVLYGITAMFEAAFEYAMIVVLIHRAPDFYRWIRCRIVG